MNKMFEQLKMKGVAKALLGVVGILLVASPAFADLMMTLNTGNSAISGFTGPYAFVDIHLVDSTHATATFTSNTVAPNIYLMGDGGTVALNINATSWTIGSFVATNAGTGFTPGPLSDGGAGNEDGFGSFNQTVNSFDGFTHSSDTISFTITNTGGTWSSAANVLTPNASGYAAAVHTFVTSSPADAANGALATGYAVDGPTASEPSTLMLLGSGIVGFAYLTVRRRRVAQS